MCRLVMILQLTALLCLSGFGCGKKDSGGGSGDSGSGSGQMPAGWVKVSMPEGRCEVWMPAQPKREVSTLEGYLASSVPVKNYLYMHDLDIRGYMANVTSVPDAKQEAIIKSLGDVDHHLKGARDRALNQEPGSKLLSDKAIEFRNCPGREFQFQSPDGGVNRFRYFFVGWQLSALATWAPKQEELTSKDAEAFFDSFKFTDVASKDK